MTRTMWLPLCLLFFGCQNSDLGNNGLNSSESLKPDRQKQSQNGHFVLVLQSDGNLVWKLSDVVLWHAGTNGTSEAECHMQADGNLVIYGNKDGKRFDFWNSETNGHPGATLACQNDGNLVIYHDSKPVWATHTCVALFPGKGPGAIQVWCKIPHLPRGDGPRAADPYTPIEIKPRQGIDKNLFLLQALEQIYAAWPTADADSQFLQDWIISTRLRLVRLKTFAEVKKLGWCPTSLAERAAAFYNDCSCSSTFSQTLDRLDATWTT